MKPCAVCQQTLTQIEDDLASLGYSEWHKKYPNNNTYDSYSSPRPIKPDSTPLCRECRGDVRDDRLCRECNKWLKIQDKIRILRNRRGFNRLNPTKQVSLEQGIDDEPDQMYATYDNDDQFGVPFMARFLCSSCLLLKQEKEELKKNAWENKSPIEKMMVGADKMATKVASEGCVTVLLLATLSTGLLAVSVVAAFASR